jgi:hypothetical protein
MRENPAGQFLTGRWAGLDVRICPLPVPDPDDQLWRTYFRTTEQGLEHDRREQLL